MAPTLLRSQVLSRLFAAALCADVRHTRTRLRARPGWSALTEVVSCTIGAAKSFVDAW